VDDLLQTHIHAVDQDLAVVFGAADHLNLAGIDDVPVGFEIRTHVLFYTVLCCMMQDPKPGETPRRLLSPGVNAGALRRILVT